METIGRLLHGKGHEIWATRPDATVFEALELMAEKNIGAVLVIDADELAGMFSERDYARKVILLGKSSKETLVSDVMTPRVICIDENQNVEECMALMTQKRIRHLPVLGDGGRVIGVVSIGDIGKAIIQEREFAIAQLEHYITGTGAGPYHSH